VLARVGLAALVFLPFLRTRGQAAYHRPVYAGGAMQLGIMYMLSFQAYLYLTVSELLLFTVLTPLYITLIYDVMSRRRCAGATPAARCWRWARALFVMTR
jgi:drug/metabolite transporter (DMT)-like permease